MTDYYQSEDYMHSQRAIGVKQGRNQAQQQILSLQEEANSKIRYLNDLVERQAHEIAVLKAELVATDKSLARTVVIANAARDTLDTLITKKPTVLAEISIYFKEFYVKYSHTALNARKINKDPFHDGEFQKTAPKTFSLLAKLLK
jgi:hypothetical protein